MLCYSFSIFSDLAGFAIDIPGHPTQGMRIPLEPANLQEDRIGRSVHSVHGEGGQIQVCMLYSQCIRFRSNH